MPIEILMPALSPTMTEGTIAKWLKKEGETISSGEVIAEIETDKATMEVETVDEGILARILVADGTQNVAVNRVIALILEEGEDQSAVDNYEVKEDKPQENAVESKEINKPEVAPADVSAAIVKPQETSAPTPPKSPKKSGTTAASPLAKRLADEYHIDLSAITGSGPAGRIVKEDVEKAHKYGGTSGLVSRDEREFELLTNSTMRRTIARRLQESKQQIPHFYLNIDINLDKMLQVRTELNADAARKAGKDAQPAYKISVNDMMIKACALAMRDVPDANASWYDDAVVRYKNIDVSVAVAIDGGLITPIIHNADQKSLPRISSEMKALAARARAGTLQPHEYEGGGFSISNLGMYSIKQFSAIINPPQACILAVGAGVKTPVVDNDGEIVVATIMNATLSVDHRAVDGAVGANFLAALKYYAHNPSLLV